MNKTRKLRLGFAGTPAFAVPSLQAILASPHDLAVVITVPDKPAGRGRQLRVSPVKALAESAGCAIWQPTTLRDDAAAQTLRDFALDLLVVIAYGMILPSAILRLPKHGCWNLHASILPRWRGAAPIARAIEAGDTQTGVALMQMDAGLDTGNVLMEHPVTIDAKATAGILHDALAGHSATLLAAGLARLADSGPWSGQAQVDEFACYAHKLRKDESMLDITEPAVRLERRIRAFHPWPGTSLDWQGERLKIHAADVVAGDGLPGTLLSLDPDGPVIATGDNALRLTKVQRPGARAISGQDFVNQIRSREHAD